MNIATFFVLLISIFNSGHPIFTKLNNENLPYVKYAIERSIENNIDPKEMVEIIGCESGFDKMAFNPEIEAKQKGITKYSSCGLLQHNDIRCDNKTSILYDGFYNIDLGIEKYKKENLNPWRNCSLKLGLLK